MVIKHINMSTNERFKGPFENLVNIFMLLIISQSDKMQNSISNAKPEADVYAGGEQITLC